jgi:hypothetical protein
MAVLSPEQMTIEQAGAWKLGLGIATACAAAVTAIAASLLPFFELRFKKLFVASDIAMAWISLLLLGATLWVGSIADEKQTKTVNDAKKIAQSLQASKDPRHITPEQEARFIKACSVLAPGERVQIEYDPDDEAHAFAVEIHRLFRKAGFTLLQDEAHMAPVSRAAKPYIGITLRVMSTENQPIHAEIIQRAFKAIGIDAPGELRTSITGFVSDIPESTDNDTLVVMVGRK